MGTIIHTLPIWLAIVCIAIVVFAFATAEEGE
jgi:cbb3-type cytochrome oxidase subunit 3